MTDIEKQAERDKLFKMFADGKTTVEELFQYFKKFAEDHPNDLRKNSPFYGRKFKIPVTAQGEDIEMSSPTLDRMIEYLLYDRDNYFLLYRRLRWNKENDDSSTYGQNIADIKEDAKSFRQQYNNISSWTLTDAVKKILVRFKNMKNTSEDKKSWERVLNIMPNTVPTAPAGPSAYDKIKDAIETSAKSKKCVVFTGAPGTGKTYCVEEYVKRVTGQDGKDRAPHPNWEFLQFHSSYDYTDFVEGLRPVQIDRKMEFVRMDGIFKAFCRRAARKEKEEEKEKFYFIIDEINRADLGRVFGELMYCFEKRGEEHRITTPYANLPTRDKHGEPLGNPLKDKDGNPLKDKDGKPLRDNDGCFEGGFYIPGNVIIIGTMNDIDRSVETFDFALRRRFDWVEIEADAVMESSLIAMMEKKRKDEKKVDRLTADDEKIVSDRVSAILPKIVAKKDDKGAIGGLNGIIETQSGLGKEFKIGPAYFKDYEDDLKVIWDHNIAPILREYMRGRQGSEEFIEKCYAELFPENETGKTSPQGSGDTETAQQGKPE